MTRLVVTEAIKAAFPRQAAILAGDWYVPPTREHLEHLAGLDRKGPIRRRTPLAPGQPLQGRKPLEVRKGLQRVSPTPDAHTAPKGPVRKGRDLTPATGPSYAVRKQVLARDDLLCVRCGGPIDTWCGYSLQHRVARAMGGRTGMLADYLNSCVNLLTLCGSGTTGCHGWVEAHPQDATMSGWSVPSWADPATVPVRHWEHGWALATPDGTWRALGSDPAHAHDFPVARLADLTGDGE